MVREHASVAVDIGGEDAVNRFGSVVYGGATGACSDGYITTGGGLGVGGVGSRRRVAAAEGSFAPEKGLGGGR